MKAIYTVGEIGLELFKKGKVRETFFFDGNLLMVATDRISAFDVVFPTPIPYKGIVLNMLSAFWFEKTKNIVENHFITTNIPENLPEVLKYRSMVVKKTKPIELECVVRGYITGSAFKEYKKTGGKLWGYELGEGLKEGARLDEPIFTPAIKKQDKDVTISVGEAKRIFGDEVVEKLREYSLKLYRFGHEYVLKKGLILADTKFEFGHLSDRIILIDEIFTPDSSRYWLKEEYEKGKLESMDKQFFRNYLLGIEWSRDNPPKIPKKIVEKTKERYLKLYEMITEKNLENEIKN
ncbi:MAG: phosphoribosylaminoimidazolesuccinocarboxamide synthase [Candidatus Anstonellales archaeon]